ncbi:MAG: hypothetical protein N2648_07195 [Aquificaceae bacterium]|nr:hypothetical protein [Aquificaceae bacterium]MCS7196969.1 hypothetical protein [Aquificaceae bacterium]MCX7990400.1 hypothetical protein [Aquificaceae bacterium]MDW8031928.1 hypothetical protein [Aquificaceae bacterium]MDW8294836.1 hypothetical protein [Aquificaceae bacterium]
MEESFREILQMEENLWQRRMKVLSQYEKLQEARDKIRRLEKLLEEELGTDIETAYKLAEEYEKSSEGVRKLKEVCDQEFIHVLDDFFYKIREIKTMKKELEHIEGEIFGLDKEIDQVFEKLKEYKKRIQGKP